MRVRSSSFGACVVLVATAVALAACPAGNPKRTTAPLETPDFVDVASVAGVAHAYTGHWTHYVGGGVAAFDCDGDRDADLFFAGGGDPVQLYRNDSTPGAITFAKIDAGISDVGVTGAYPLDLDSDGAMDLVVLRHGENHIYRGLGDCSFARANDVWGIDGGEAWTTAFSAIWEGDNRLPTLAFGNYVDRDVWTSLRTPFGRSAERSDRIKVCPDNVLFRPQAPDAGRYAPGLALSPGHCPLSMLFSDWSRSGRPDLRISNDRFYHEDTGEEQLWHMAPAPKLYGRDDGWEKQQIWGMGIASYDITGDGLPEYFLSNMAANRLEALAPNSEGTPRYRDIAYVRGVEARRPHVGTDERPSTAWHSQFGDVNNDGRIDLFVAKGNVEKMEEAAAADPNNLLLGGPDGNFEEAAAEAGASSMRRSRGGALIDLDLDGLLDIVVVNRLDNVEILHNQSQARGHWLQVMVRQPPPNRDAIGAWLEVVSPSGVWRQEVVVGGGHVSGQSGWIHVGLGERPDVKLRVQWPDGTWGPWHFTKTNRFLVLERGRAIRTADVGVGGSVKPFAD